jgi:hypothetical protein
MILKVIKFSRIGHSGVNLKKASIFTIPSLRNLIDINCNNVKKLQSRRKFYSSTI